jgi:hypothetical protein
MLKIWFYLAFVDLVGEELVDEQIVNVGVLVKRGLDVAQELTSDDAAALK